MFLTLALVTALFRPASPTVGDAVTIDFERPAVLAASPDYEVVSRAGNRIVIRVFTPKPLPLSGVLGGTIHFQNLILPMRSVLKDQNDNKPSPLVPPREGSPSRLPKILIISAAFAAAVGWVTAFVMSRGTAAAAEGFVPRDPVGAFRRAVEVARSARQHWAALADALRAYLDARGIGAELTTSQVLARVAPRLDDLDDDTRQRHYMAIREILQRGDLEKFSPWGAPSGDPEPLARAALDLVEVFEPRPEPTQEAAA